MPKYDSDPKPNSYLLLEFAIKFSKFLIFLCIVYFSYFFLYTTQIGEGIVTQVAVTLEQSKEFINENLDLTRTPVENNVYEREINTETLTKLTSDELIALGVVKLPYGFQVQEEYKGVKFVRSPKKSYSEIQIKLLKYFIDNAPRRLLEPGPDALVIFETDEINYEDRNILNPATLAFASGTYIFLSNTTFEGTENSLKTVDESLQTFFHELMHIAQFNYEMQYLTEEDIYEMALAGKDWTELIKSSELTQSFGNLTEWEYSEDRNEYTLPDPDTIKTTKYGRTSIYEDIAETVAGTATSQIHYYSDDRIKWALYFLEDDYETITSNMFPFNESLEPVRQNTPRLNFAKEEEYKTRFEITDRQFFIVEQQNTIRSVSEYFTERLPARGFQGTFVSSTDRNGVQKYQGEFVGTNRTMYIELESFDSANGYTVKPKGTIVNIINGYRF